VQEVVVDLCICRNSDNELVNGGPIGHNFEDWIIIGTASPFFAGKIRIKEPPFPVISKTQGTCGFYERTSKELCISDSITSILPQKWKKRFIDFLRTEIVRLKNQSDNWQGLVPFLIPS
jgi:hypothetical protein